MAKKITKVDIDQNLTDKRKMADIAISQIRSNFGQGSIMKMNERAENVDVISTGSLIVDIATGVGGFAKGRIIEIYGPESSGKTTLALSTIAQAQKQGGLAAFVDAEHALNSEWASKLGVNLDDLYVSQPDNGEAALEIVESLVRSNAFDVIVIDSVAALVPKSEIEGNMGDSQMGVQARLMSQALRKLTGAISKSNTVVIFINQIRLKIGVMFGSPETTTGGNALKFFASQRLDIRKIGALKAGTENVGIRIKVKIVKNKLAAPFKEAEFDAMFNEPGVISIAGEIIDVGQNYDVIIKNGNTYTLNLDGMEPFKLDIGRDKAKAALYANQDLMIRARNEIIDKFMKTLKPTAESTVYPQDINSQENQENSFEE